MVILHTRKCYLAAKSNRPMTCAQRAHVRVKEVTPQRLTLCDSVAAPRRGQTRETHLTPLVARDWGRGRVQYRRGSRELLVREENVSYPDCSHTQLQVVVKPIELCT